ncbi:tyrosine-type recombinase/integrase [Paenibacillus chitinolyticus]|uniref:tyrosine-type recombinase/integrase n=1 Tax=Paenibacillus chitinolyticus TaxID=79263 RepID=UPI003D066DD4
MDSAIGHESTAHTLRHSYAVHLLEAGANIKNVSERLRHISVKVTADTFLYIAQKIKEELCPSMSDTLRDKD